MTAGIALVVTVVWAASFVADLLVPTYDPPTELHAAMLMVVGGIFGVQAIRK